MWVWLALPLVAWFVSSRTWVVAFAVVATVLEWWVVEGVGAYGRDGSENWWSFAVPVLCLAAAGLALALHAACRWWRGRAAPAAG